MGYPYLALIITVVVLLYTLIYRIYIRKQKQRFLDFGKKIEEKTNILINEARRNKQILKISKLKSTVGNTSLDKLIQKKTTETNEKINEMKKALEKHYEERKQQLEQNQKISRTILMQLDDIAHKDRENDILVTTGIKKKNHNKFKKH